MKTDRLLGITIYLLNHGKTGAKKLAERFEVSKRTIQRDAEALELAGIPIISEPGAGGGYSLPEKYKLNSQLASEADYSHIITALKGLISAYDNKKLEDTLEKIMAANPGNGTGQRIILDFGVLREGRNTTDYIKLIDEAIGAKKSLEINYTNAQNKTGDRIIEPLAVIYKWYSWYLFGYCTTKKDYRLFKLPRIGGITQTGKSFSMEHGNINNLIDNFFSSDSYDMREIKLLCKAEAKILAMEYLGGEIIEELDNGDVMLLSKVVESERLWFSLLLSFGGAVKVLEPAEIAERASRTAKEICEAYNK